MEEMKTTTVEIPNTNVEHRVTVIPDDQNDTIPVAFEKSDLGMGIIEIRIDSAGHSEIKARINVQNNIKNNAYRKLNLLYGVK